MWALIQQQATTDPSWVFPNNVILKIMKLLTDLLSSSGRGLNATNTCPDLKVMMRNFCAWDFAREVLIQPLGGFL